ncbi:MAG: septal ring lytic transglycosylase RlpA family protein [Alphaproteobacteria bacterium]|nr:septal ring lytic transglycosylase RlpA family protein [Alphaproteobacteria bacterium]
MLWLATGAAFGHSGGAMNDAATTGCPAIRPDRCAARPSAEGRARRAMLSVLAGLAGWLAGAGREAAANTGPATPAASRRGRRTRRGQAARRRAAGTGQTGIAAWYGPGFVGRRTASGERFDPHAMAAAHRTLPFGARVRVTSLDTGRSVVVRINDRGPHTLGRIIDLTEGAARQIGLRARGVGRVRIERLS